MKSFILVMLYLSAIVIANLLDVHFGPKMVAINSFFLIGLDLTCRDVLHEKWTHNRFWKLLALILAGSFISWLLNRDAQKIALASGAAFLLAGLTDTVVYAALFKSSRFAKVNISNVCSSIVDTFIFLFLAFGLPFAWPALLLNIVAKIAGGYIWSWVLFKFKDTKVRSFA